MSVIAEAALGMLMKLTPEWDGVDEIKIDANELWIPDVVLWNGEQVPFHTTGFRDGKPKVLPI